jgi:hypothetical protein
MAGKKRLMQNVTLSPGNLVVSDEMFRCTGEKLRRLIDLKLDMFTHYNFKIPMFMLIIIVINNVSRYLHQWFLPDLALSKKSGSIYYPFN